MAKARKYDQWSSANASVFFISNLIYASGKSLTYPLIIYIIIKGWLLPLISQRIEWFLLLALSEASGFCSPIFHLWAAFASLLWNIDILFLGLSIFLPQAPLVSSAWFFDRDRPAFISTCWQVRKKALRGTNSMWLRFSTASRLKYLPAELH